MSATAQLVIDALVMAIWRRGKPDPLLQTRSRKFSEQFQSLMADHGHLLDEPLRQLLRQCA